jgi:DNA-binding PadR family transcriptional regulator
MAKTSTNTSVQDSFDLELRRGVIVLAVLSQLYSEQYGYSLKRALAEGGLEVDEGTLYPLLRRLESQGLLESAWRMEEARPRRYYSLSAEGRKAQRALATHWRSLVKAMDQLLD